MNKGKKGYDEMQTARRNSIGSQMFVLVLLALLVDGLLFSRGIVWLAYPHNIAAIISACALLYVIRVIIAGAYLPPYFQGASNWVL